MTDPKELKSIGPYKFYHVIGEGSFSVVRTAMIDNSDKIYAVKIIPKVRLVERQLASRFQLEIRVMQCLHHPSIIRIHNIFKDKKFYYVVMEYCSGGCFADYISNNRQLSEEDCKFYMHQLFSGMEFIHNLKICHRDLKPQNILLDATKKFIKISDFGLSKFVLKNSLTTTPVGSLLYASPECLSGKPYDPIKSDIWSCGVIMYVALTGKSPWIGQKPAHIMAQIKKGHYEMPSYLSPECKRLLQAILTTDAQSRPTDTEILEFDWFKNTRRLNSSSYKMIENDMYSISIRTLDNFFGRDLKSSAFTDSFDNLFKTIDQSEDLLLPQNSIHPDSKTKPNDGIRLDKSPSVLDFEIDFERAKNIMLFKRPDIIIKTREIPFDPNIDKFVRRKSRSSSHDSLPHNDNDEASAHVKHHVRPQSYRKSRTSSHSVFRLDNSDLNEAIRAAKGSSQMSKNYSAEDQLARKKTKRPVPLGDNSTETPTTKSEGTPQKKSTVSENDSKEVDQDEKQTKDDSNNDDIVVQEEISKKGKKAKKEKKKKKKHAFTLPRINFFKKKGDAISPKDFDDKSDDSPKSDDK